MNHQSDNQEDALIQAQETIASQAREIEELQRQLEREHFARELGKLLVSAKTTNIILSPFTHSRLLEIVVSTAVQVIAARSGSLFLIDEEAKDLVFEVAIGPAAQEAKKYRVPLGHGIAGMVALTGQPMAIADVPRDGQFAFDIANSIDYIPQSILCVPLYYDDRIIGALELLDKIDVPSFRPEDMDALGLFANIAAIAIAQSQAYHDQQTILVSFLRSFGEMEPERRQRLSDQALSFSNWVQTENPINAIGCELALLVRELIESGEQESEMCKSILQGIVTNIRSRNESYQFTMSKR